MRERLKALIPPFLLNLRFRFGASLAYRPGHVYSPICDRADLCRHYRDPRSSIDLNEQAQRNLWASWSDYLRDFSFPWAGKIGHWGCGWNEEHDLPQFMVGPGDDPRDKLWR